MRNLGSVEIKGIDATGSLSLQPWESIRINFSGNYTYQRALDVTTPDASSNKSTYKHQIAYTPRVSASGQAGIETPWIDLSYSSSFRENVMRWDRTFPKTDWPVTATTVFQPAETSG